MGVNFIVVECAKNSGYQELSVAAMVGGGRSTFEKLAFAGKEDTWRPVPVA